MAGDQLCVVVAGRTGAEDILDHVGEAFEVQKMRLEPFNIDEARELVSRLGRQLMADGWDEAWTNPIAGARSDPPLRREPLTLRLAVELVRDADPGRRGALVDEIAAEGSGARASFLGNLYRHRILDHVKDPSAQKLAWPGLVARTVTRRLVREVLAPLCDLTPDEAEIGFERLRAEGWIVEDLGDALHHRRDLRARTLPLMRATGRETYETVIRRLIDYYDSGPEADPVEADYYRLLLGDRALLDRDWQNSTLTELANAIEDFEPGSPARQLIALANATRPVAPEMLRGLPPNQIWRHAARACTSLRTFDDERIDPRLLHMIDVPPPDETGADADTLTNAWQHTQIKTGQWDRIRPEALSMPLTEIDTTIFGFYAAQMTWAGMVAPSFWGKHYPELLQRLGTPRLGRNWRAVAESLSVARAHDPDLWREIDASLVEAPPRGSHWARSAEIGLRAILMNGHHSRATAFRPWCQMEAVRARHGIAFREADRFLALRTALDLTRPCPALDRAMERQGKGSRADRLLSDKAALSEVAIGFEEMSDASLPDPKSPLWGRVTDYLSIRSPEWIVPFAYLLTRATGRPDGGAPEAKSRSNSLFSLFSRSESDRPEDLLQSLSDADRAGLLDDTLHGLIRKTGSGDRQMVQVWRAAREVAPRPKD